MESNNSGGDKKMPRKKLVVVGDGACGKTSLLIAYTKNEFTEDYIPTIFETYVTEIQLPDHRVQIALWDTAGQEDYELLRPLSYPNTNIVLLCFAVDSRDSFENIFQKWIPEVRHFCPRTPVLLVATKTDLRQEHESGGGSSVAAGNKKVPVSHAEGVKMAKSINAAKYVECSSKMRDGIQEVFQTAARIAIGQNVGKQKNGRRGCTLL